MMLLKPGIRTSFSLIIILSSLFLSACGGGGGGDSAAPPTSDVSLINGIWSGTFHSQNTGLDYDLIGLVQNGEVRLISNQSNTMLAGTASVLGETVNVILINYQIGGAIYAQTTINGTYISGATISGTYSSTNGDSGTISLTYDKESYEKVASLDLTKGIWSKTDGAYNIAISINTDGTFDGADTAGCIFDGNVTVIKSDRNMYNVEFTVSNCGSFNGAYNGFGVVSDTMAVNDTLSIIVNNANYVFFVNFARQ